MEAYTLEKVITPYENMPEVIADAFRKGIAYDYGNPANDTFIRWEVGGFIEDVDLHLVDEWMLANGLTRGETVIVLYSW